MDLAFSSRRVPQTEVPTDLPIVEQQEAERPAEKTAETPEQAKKSAERQTYDRLADREYELRQESEDIFGLEKLGKEGYQQLVDVFGAEAVVEALAEVEYLGSTKMGDVIKSLEPDAKKRKALYADLQARITASGFEDPSIQDKPYSERTPQEHEFLHNGPTPHNKRVAEFSLSTAQAWENPLFMKALQLINGSTSNDSSMALRNLGRIDFAALRAELLANPNIYQVAAEKRIALDEKQKAFYSQVDTFITELENKIDEASVDIDIELEERRHQKTQELAQVMQLSVYQNNQSALNAIHDQIMNELHSFEKMAEERREREVEPLEDLKNKANWINR